MAAGQLGPRGKGLKMKPEEMEGKFEVGILVDRGGAELPGTV